MSSKRPEKEGKETLSIKGFISETAGLLLKEKEQALEHQNKLLEAQLANQREEIEIAKNEFKAEQEQLKREFEAKQEQIRREFEREYNIYRQLMMIFAGLILVTLVIIFLNGFNAWGFNLSDTTIQLLAGSTIAEAAGLLGIVVKGLFK